MKRSAWVVTAVLVALAVGGGWFFGLDQRHAVALTGAAFGAGVVNGLLDAVHLPRILPPPPARPELGSVDVRALEFSLSSAEPGARAVLELRAAATGAVALRPNAPRSAALSAFLASRGPVSPGRREITGILEELDDLTADPPVPDQENR